MPSPGRNMPSSLAGRKRSVKRDDVSAVRFNGHISASAAGRIKRSRALFRSPLALPDGEERLPHQNGPDPLPLTVAAGVAAPPARAALIKGGRPWVPSTFAPPPEVQTTGWR